MSNINIPDLSAYVLPETSRKKTKPIYAIEAGTDVSRLSELSPRQKTWLAETNYTANPGEIALLPAQSGEMESVIIATGEDSASAPWPNTMSLGNLPQALPAGNYHFANESDPDTALLFWLLGAYRFDTYRTETPPAIAPVSLKPAKATSTRITTAIAEAVWLGRDLINTPAEDLGPEELEQTVRLVAKHHKAKVKIVAGDALLEENFPLIHTVGRASQRPPRLIELNWGSKTAPKITLVGKGICFDTGGLNLKPGNSMSLMKKDMGGAAAALSLAHMIMSAKLPVRLRLLIAAADNNLSANSFRPGDVYKSRNGMTVEISNTDAEGRLVLADALALADEEAPDYLFDFATLTGSARVALGPDMPPFFTTSDALANNIVNHAQTVGDPLWRLPLWNPYMRYLKASTADINHCGETSFAGSITAALFLKRFVSKAENYAHFDIYGWTPAPLAAKPKGGEPQAARAIFSLLNEMFAGKK